MTARRLLEVGLVLLIILNGFNTYQGFNNASGLSSESTQTCNVQKRGLKAQPHLTRVMQDLALLLTPRPGDAPPPNRIAGTLTDLRRELQMYVSIESGLPRHRTCQTG